MCGKYVVLPNAHVYSKFTRKFQKKVRQPEFNLVGSIPLDRPVHMLKIPINSKETLMWDHCHWNRVQPK